MQTRLIVAFDNQMATQPNNEQAAIATYIIGRLTENPRNIWALPAAMGKSRVIAYSGLIALTQLNVKHVHFVTQSKMLLQRDREEFSDLWVMSDTQSRVTYHSTLEFEKDANDLVLVDEVDFFVLDDHEKTDQLLVSANTIVFTATVGDLNSMILKCQCSLT